MLYLPNISPRNAMIVAVATAINNIRADQFNMFSWAEVNCTTSVCLAGGLIHHLFKDARPVVLPRDELRALMHPDSRNKVPEKGTYNASIVYKGARLDQGLSREGATYTTLFEIEDSAHSYYTVSRKLVRAHDGPYDIFDPDSWLNDVSRTTNRYPVAERVQTLKAEADSYFQLRGWTLPDWEIEAAKLREEDDE